MPKIKHAQLEWNDLGTPISEQFDDVYFSNNDGLAETRYVFLTQNRLPERWQTCTQSRFVIAETGFGTGLNFLAVWQWFEQFREQNPDAPLTQLHFISFEKFPVTLHDLKKAHSAWPELEQYAQELQQSYPSALPECQRLVLAGGAITLDLWLGDIKDNLPNVPTYADGIVDAWFLDGFAPSKNPEMWNQDLFNGMVKLAKQDCTVATFTAAGFVRRGLMEAGFTMKKAKGFGHKRDMIVGSVEQKTPYSNISPLFDVQPALGLDDNNSVTRQDIAIVGGGIASASLAWSLLQRGSKITLYCKDSATAQGASGNQQGALYPLLNGDHSAVSRLFAPSFTFARQFYDAIGKQVDFDHSWCGVTQLLWNETEQIKLSKLLQGQFPDDIVIGLNAEQTQQTVGLDCSVGAVHYPLGGWLSPQQCTQGLFDYLAKHKDCTLVFECEVNTLKQTQDTRWHLQTNQGEFTHHTVVLANGHHFDQFDQTKHIPLSKVKGQVSTIPTTDALQKLNTVLCYDGYLTPQNPNTGHHCIGASYDMNNLTTDFDPKAQKQNAEKLQACLPDQTWPHQVNVDDNQSRQGIRTVSRDHLPFVGNIGQYESIIQDYANLRNQPIETVPPVTHYRNLFSFMGLGSRGLTSAPLLGEVLASLIHKQPLPLSVKVLETIHPSRIWVRKLRKGRPLPLKNTRN